MACYTDPVFCNKIILWATANCLSMISTVCLIFAILRSPKTRKSPFNLYLVFSLLPDAYKNLSGFIANIVNYQEDGKSLISCTVIGWSDSYWWCANLWMAFVIFSHLHKMLVKAKKLKAHDPPEIPRVLKESTVVHIFSIIMASLTLIPADFIPKATGSTGCEAFPAKENSSQLIFYWAFFMPVTALIPTVLVTLLWLDIFWRKLLPLNGKTRSLLFYFVRLLAVIYIVAIAVIVSFKFNDTGGWVQAIAFMVFNLVGLLSVFLALMKKDVRNAWVQMWRCQPSQEVPTRNESELTQFENEGRASKQFSFFVRMPSQKATKSLILHTHKNKCLHVNVHDDPLDIHLETDERDSAFENVDMGANVTPIKSDDLDRQAIESR